MKTSYFILFVILISTVSVTTVYAQESLLPEWIKTIAGFWSSNQIGDEEFIGALQYLVKEGILVIPSENKETSLSNQSQSSKQECSGSARCFTGTVTKIIDADTIETSARKKPVRIEDILKCQ